MSSRGVLQEVLEFPLSEETANEAEWARER